MNNNDLGQKHRTVSPQNTNVKNDSNNNEDGDGDDKEDKADKDGSKGKRQTKDTKNADNNLYANHRIDSDMNDDDPEIGQETIYTPNPRQFLIRPANEDQQRHPQHLLHAAHQAMAGNPIVTSAQLRNYPVTIRPHNTQQLEQSQEVSINFR